MPYGSAAIDSIESSGNLAITGNVTATGTLASSAGTTYPLVSETVQTASGSSVNFTGIPNWVKRITVVGSNITFAAATGVSKIRIGSGSLVTSGYTTNLIGGTSYSSYTDGLGSFTTNSTTNQSGFYILAYLGNNIWVSSGVLARAGDSLVQTITGTVTLSGTLDRLSIVATTSTFTAGSFNILYE